MLILECFPHLEKAIHTVVRLQDRGSTIHIRKLQELGFSVESPGNVGVGTVPLSGGSHFYGVQALLP